MRLLQIAKRVTLFVVVNILVVLTIGVLVSLTGLDRYLSRDTINGLLIFCLIWGFSGALISLALSRVMAKWMMGVKVIPPDARDPYLRQLVMTVHELARAAGLPAMPEVGIYESPEPNAFATGPSRARSLVAVSTGLLEKMTPDQIRGVLGHEVAHIANGDMVTMTLIQGVINAFVLFLSRILAFVIVQAARGRDSRGNDILMYMLVMVFQIVFSLLGAIVVCWFSRMREFRADAGGARLAGRQSMIDALRALQRLYDPELAAIEAQRAQAFQAFKISGKQSKFLRLFTTHPPLEERIMRLQQLRD